MLPFALLSALAASPALGQEALIDSLFRANRYPVTLKDGQLSGPGADYLRGATENAQFVMIGEFHNGADIPAFTTSLFRDLQTRRGFNYLALENDPEIMRQMTEPPVRGVADSLAVYARRFKHGLQFWNDEEIEMIASVSRASTATTQPVWGLDQVWGTQHMLTRLRALAPNSSARTAVDSLLAWATALEAVRPTTPGAQLKRYIDDADSLEFRKLRAAYGPAAGSEADRLITSMELSNRIYQVRGYVGNNTREQNMKAMFMEQYRAAQRSGSATPRVLARFGHVHAIRGFNFLNVQTLGNFLSEFARSNGEEMFSMTVYLINEPGTYWTLHDTPAYKLLANVGSTEQWYIVDFRPLRSRVNRLTGLSADLKSIILGFDAALMIGSGTRGTFHKVH